MAHFAILVNNTVVNTIVAETKELAESIYPGSVLQEFDSSFPINIGMVFDGTTFNYAEQDNQ
jgi:hypothetical protein